MSVELGIQNLSGFRGYHRRDVLTRLAEKVCAGEGLAQDAEVSLVLCDDAFIQDLNAQYRKKNKPTDVLSFEQDGIRPDGVRMLGDIIISMETLARECANDAAHMRADVRLLFCHGLLHLLGHDHPTRAARALMQARQAGYLGVAYDAAWRDEPPAPTGAAQARSARGRTAPRVGKR
jgi:probable rRNA maturation factor